MPAERIKVRIASKVRLTAPRGEFEGLGGSWDAIYANAVSLHLNREELKHVLTKAAAAIVPGRVLAFALKEGDGAAWTTTTSRHFTYWREPALQSVVGASPWRLISLDRAAGESDDWLYSICLTVSDRHTEDPFPHRPCDARVDIAAMLPLLGGEVRVRAMASGLLAARSKLS